MTNDTTSDINSIIPSYDPDDLAITETAVLELAEQLLGYSLARAESGLPRDPDSIKDDKAKVRAFQELVARHIHDRDMHKDARNNLTMGMVWMETELGQWIHQGQLSGLLALAGDNQHTGSDMASLPVSSYADHGLTRKQGSRALVIRKVGMPFVQSYFDDCLAQGKTITVTETERAARKHLAELARVNEVEDLRLDTDQQPSFLLGDCLDYLPDLQPGSIRLLLTDPPYGTGFQSNRRVASPQERKIEGDDEQAFDLLSAMLEASDQAMADESHLLIFTSWRYEPEFRQVIEDQGWQIRGSLVWVKENHTSGDLEAFAPQHERIIHATRGNASIQPRTADVLSVARQHDTHHPAEKPVDLCRRLIECTTSEGDTILDPFAGTAATLVAAIGIDRIPIGYEKDEEWHLRGTKRLNEISTGSSD